MVVFYKYPFSVRLLKSICIILYFVAVGLFCHNMMFLKKKGLTFVNYSLLFSNTQKNPSTVDANSSMLLLNKDTISKVSNYFGKLTNNENTEIIIFVEERGTIGSFITSEKSTCTGINIVDKNGNKIVKVSIPANQKIDGKDILFEEIHGVKKPIPISKTKIGDSIVRTIKFDMIKGMNIADEFVISS